MYSVVNIDTKQGIRHVLVGGQIVGWCAFDEVEAEGRCGNVECMALSKGENGMSWNVLLVERVNINVGRRVGVGEVLNIGWEAVPMKRRGDKVIVLE